MAQDRTLDMTQGRILPVMLQFAVPVMLGNLFQNLYSLADMSIAGYTIGDHALAAISATTALVTLINATAMGFNMGNSIFVSHSFGAGDWAQTRRNFAGMVELCFALIVLFTVGLLLTIDPLLRLIRTPAELMADARTYTVVLICGLCATMLYNMLAGAFRALGNSRVPLLFLIFSSALNVALDLLFIVPLGMGVRGAALATVMSQGVSAVLSALWFCKSYPQLRLRRADFCRNGPILKEMLPMGLSAALTNSLFAVGDIAVQGALNTLGPDAIIAQASARKILSFCIIPSIGITNTCATFAAQNYGARQLKRITKGVKTANLFSLCCNAVTYLLVFFFGGAIIRLITNTDSAAVVRDGVLMLRIVAAFIFTQTIVMTFRMSVQGMNRKVIPMVGTGIELLTRCFCALVLAPSLGFLGICFAEPLSWVVSGAVMVLCYVRVLRQELRAEENRLETMKTV